MGRGRRRFLTACLAWPVPFLTAARRGWPDPLLPATPECPDDEVTPEVTAGPFFKPRSPGRTSLLEPGLEGERVVLSGQVLSRQCRPVGNALLDFWQADAEGRYDLAGYRLRGHQRADEAGRYRLETVLPGPYSGRTRHIHVRVQPPGGPLLTTQLFFPGERRNDADFLFRPQLVMSVSPAAAGLTARFDFVLERAGG